MSLIIQLLLGVIYVKNIDMYVMYMIQYKHAKLLRQCVLFWPRNRLSRERMTAPADT